MGPYYVRPRRLNFSIRRWRGFDQGMGKSLPVIAAYGIPERLMHRRKFKGVPKSLVGVEIRRPWETPLKTWGLLRGEG